MKKPAWDPEKFSPISSREIVEENGKYKVRGKEFDRFQDAEEYVYHINQFREPYAGPTPRVMTSKKYAWYVFAGIPLLVAFLLDEPNMVEYKFKSYDEAEKAGIFSSGAIPTNIPKNIRYLLVKMDTDTGTIWAKFNADRDEITRLMSTYRPVLIKHIDTINFPTITTYPWVELRLNRLAEMYGENQVRIAVGECALGGGYAILISTGQSGDVFYGCDPVRSNKALQRTP